MPKGFPVQKDVDGVSPSGRQHRPRQAGIGTGPRAREQRARALAQPVGQALPQALAQLDALAQPASALAGTAQSAPAAQAPLGLAATAPGGAQSTISTGAAGGGGATGAGRQHRRTGRAYGTGADRPAQAPASWHWRARSRHCVTGMGNTGGTTATGLLLRRPGSLDHRIRPSFAPWSLHSNQLLLHCSRFTVKRTASIADRPAG